MNQLVNLPIRPKHPLKESMEQFVRSQPWSQKLYEPWRWSSLGSVVKTNYLHYQALGLTVERRGEASWALVLSTKADSWEGSGLSVHKGFAEASLFDSMVRVSSTLKEPLFIDADVFSGSVESYIITLPDSIASSILTVEVNGKGLSHALVQASLVILTNNHCEVKVSELDLGEHNLYAIDCIYSVKAHQRLTYSQLTEPSVNSKVVWNNRFYVAEGAELKGIHFTHQGHLFARYNSRLYLLGEGSKADFGHIGYIKGSSVQDSFIKASHLTKHTEANFWTRYWVEDSSEVIGQSKTQIVADCKDAISKQFLDMCMNSTDCKVKVKPEFDIIHDHVECIHGVTVSQFDKDQLFYLASRGINKEIAFEVLKQSFLMKQAEVLPDTLQELIQQAVNNYVNAFNI